MDYFKAFIKYWGSDGYLYYDKMVKNNHQKLDKNALNYFTNLILKTDGEIKMKILCKSLSQHLSESFFSEILNSNLESNVNGKYFIKNINISNNLENIKPNRWMSFSMVDDIFIGNLQYGTEVLLFNNKYVSYIDTMGIADKHEVLINSNELLPLFLSKSYGYINPINFPSLKPEKVLFHFSQLISYMQNNHVNSGNINKACNNLKIDNDLLSIEKFLTKHIPETIIFNDV